MKGYRLWLCCFTWKKETEWMLKSRTVYSYGSNNRIEDKDQLSRAKNVKICLGKISQPTTYNTKR